MMPAAREPDDDKKSRSSDDPSNPGAPAKPLPEEQQADAYDIFRLAVETGQRRLARAWSEMVVAGFVAGMNVTFGLLAAASVAGASVAAFGDGFEPFAGVLGAIVFPIGFIFVVIGRSELFTENFLVPTASVIARRAPIASLLLLWLCTLIGNLLGAVVVAFMVSLEHYHGVPAVHTVDHIQHMAEYLALERDWDASFYSAVFAGWLITLMTWLLLAARDTLARISIIWCVGFLIMLSKFNHVVVNGAEILMAKFTGDELITYTAWFQGNFAPTILGNMVGGLVFVTLLEYLKVMRAPTKWR